MKKRFVLSVIALSLSALLLIGGTFAWIGGLTGATKINDTTKGLMDDAVVKVFMDTGDGFAEINGVIDTSIDVGSSQSYKITVDLPANAQAVKKQNVCISFKTMSEYLFDSQLINYYLGTYSAGLFHFPALNDDIDSTSNELTLKNYFTNGMTGRLIYEINDLSAEIYDKTTLTTTEVTDAEGEAETDVNFPYGTQFNLWKVSLNENFAENILINKNQTLTVTFRVSYKGSGNDYREYAAGFSSLYKVRFLKMFDNLFQGGAYPSIIDFSAADYLEKLNILVDGYIDGFTNREVQCLCSNVALNFSCNFKVALEQTAY